MFRTGHRDPIGSQSEAVADRVTVIQPRVAAAFDVAFSVLLAAVAYAMRRDGLPTNGLWFDDSWVAAGANFATPMNLMTTGSGHPGFTALVALVALIDRMGGGFTAMAVPALIAGCLGPVAIYWLLRKVGQARAVAVLFAVVLVVAPTHILYSGRVKSYTFDVLWVSLFTWLVVRLTSVRWTWRVTVAWLAVVAVGTTFSGYVLVASAVAAFILVIHGGTDRWMRVAATAIQGIGQLTYFLVARSKTDLDGIETVMESSYDAHMTFHTNPIEFVEEALRHLHRVAQVYPSGPDALATAAAVVAVLGLAFAALGGRPSLAIDRRTTLASQYLITLVAFAFAGSMLDRFPFGPTNDILLSQGGRHTIWLIPALVVGLAVVTGLAWKLIARQGARPRLAANVLLISAAVAVLGRGYRDAYPYPQSGSSLLAKFVDESRRPDDVVVITSQSTFLYPLSTSAYVGIVPTPTHQVGFAPVFADRSIHAVGVWGTEPSENAHLKQIIKGANRVFVVGGGWIGYGAVDQVNAVAQAKGYAVTVHKFGTEMVWLWERPRRSGAPPDSGS